jgi:hypothetical protein
MILMKGLRVSDKKEGDKVVSLSISINVQHWKSKAKVDVANASALDCNTFSYLPGKVNLDQPTDFDRQRRVDRVVMRVPVGIRGTVVDGSVLDECTHTEVVGTLGAMIRTSRPLQMGSEVTVTNRFSQQIAKFRVVWAGENQKEGFWEMGIETLQSLNDFWGVRFPPKPAAE